MVRRQGKELHHWTSRSLKQRPFGLAALWNDLARRTAMDSWAWTCDGVSETAFSSDTRRGRTQLYLSSLFTLTTTHNHHQYQPIALLLQLLKNVEVARTRLPSVGFRGWSRFLAVSLQVMWVMKMKIVYSVWQQCMLDSHNYNKIQTQIRQ